MENEAKQEVTQELTPENWKTLCQELANPQCNKCYGRGYTGWHTLEDGMKMPVLCAGKRCTITSYRLVLRAQRIKEMQQKQKEAAEKVEKEGASNDE